MHFPNFSHEVSGTDAVHESPALVWRPLGPPSAPGFWDERQEEWREPWKHVWGKADSSAPPPPSHPPPLFIFVITIFLVFHHYLSFHGKIDILFLPLLFLFIFYFFFLHRAQLIVNIIVDYILTHFNNWSCGSGRWMMLPDPEACHKVASDSLHKFQ